MTDRSNDLTYSSISSFLPFTIEEDRLTVLGSVDSTNTYLKGLFTEYPDRSVAVADMQTGGRGRNGRSFYSPYGKGLYLSFLFKPEVSPSDVQNFTGYAAVAVCDGIESCCGIRPSIKWTNDILMNGLKVCGILTESAVSASGNHIRYLICGVGINVLQGPDDFPKDLSGIAGSVSMAGCSVTRSELAASVIGSVFNVYDAWLGKDISYVSRYRKDCITLGRDVRIVGMHGEETAFARDIDERFGLIVDYPDGSSGTVTFGDVSVRGLLGYN